MDETIALPSDKAVKIALRTQQIIAHESGVTNMVDPLGGSYFLERLTLDMEEGAYRYFDTIDKMGGMVAAVERVVELDSSELRRDAEARFSVDQMVNGYIAAYESMIAGRRPVEELVADLQPDLSVPSASS